MVVTSDYDLIIGERVIQNKFGHGTVCDVIYDKKGKISQFCVEFDSGIEKTFAFPVAFKSAMRLESGEKVEVNEVVAKPAAVTPPGQTVKKTRILDNKASKNDTYAYWANKYPDYVVIKKEGYFWSCRGESAETVSDLLGYKLGMIKDVPFTGSPNLDNITDGLSSHKISYIAIEDGDIVEQRTFE